MKFKISTKRFNQFIILVLYKFTLDLVYILNIHDIYGYLGYTQHFNIKYLFLSIFYLFLLKFIISLYNNSTISDVAVLLFSILYFIPGLTLLSFMNAEWGYIMYFLSFWILILIFQKIVKPIKLPDLKLAQSQILFYVIIFSTIVLALLITGMYNGFKFHWNIFDVYGIRAEERGLKTAKIVGYIKPLISILIPISVVFFLKLKKYFLVGTLIILQLFLFAMGGHKTTFFLLVIAILAFYFYKNKRLTLIPIGLVALNISALVEKWLVDGISYITFFVQYRSMLIPNMISYQYYELIKSNEILYFRQSFLRHFFENPYPKSIAFIIGEQTYNSDFVRSNNGMCGDAFSQLGWASLMLHPFLIVFSFKLLQSVSYGIDTRITFVAIISYVFYFINISFFSVYLTNGFLFTLVFIFLISNLNKSNDKI